MNALESKLCWDIINCPNSCPGQCNAIVSLQASNEYWQIPEPWNGFLTSGFLVIAGNPALDDAELYPATSSSSSLSWVGPGVWDKDIVESYFEGRFGKSTNPAFPMKKGSSGKCIDGDRKIARNSWQMIIFERTTNQGYHAYQLYVPGTRSARPGVHQDTIRR